MAHNLPSGYTELEYIESTGTEYIDTGYIPNQNTGYYIDFIPMEPITKNNAKQYVNAGGRSGSNNRIVLGAYNEYGGGDFVFNTFKIDPKLVQDVRTVFEIKNKEIHFSDGTITSINTSNFTSPNTLILFGANGNPVERIAKARIYLFKLYNLNDTIKELIPAKNNNDVVGLYDIINDVFFTNVGTGSFIAGPEIQPEPEPEPDPDPEPDIIDTIISEVDWSDSMEQTFEYHEVDPNTWKDMRLLTMVKKCNIKFDEDSDTLGSATIDINDTLGECYIRVYLVVRQNGGKFRFTLGTFLVQTPSSSYDGKNRNVSMDAYTPLLELKENPPPLGFALLKNENIMRQAYLLIRDNCRAPVIETSLDKLLQDNFVADPNEKWLSYISDLIGQVKYRLSLDEEGKILFAPNQRLDELQPVWTYNDDNSSILYPEVTMQHDLYGIPNVVEVVCSTGVKEYTTRVVNDDPNSPTSTVNRGREIIHRDTDPNLPGLPSEEQIDEYARNLLETLSSVEYQVSYTHGYCPVRVGDAVRLNYKRAGLDGIKAKVISQSITCENGCSVNETAIFTKKLWN